MFMPRLRIDIPKSNFSGGLPNSALYNKYESLY